MGKETFFVLGLGKSGRAAACLLVDKGYRVTVFDDDESRVTAFAASPEYTSHSEQVALADPGTARDAVTRNDVMVVSPGISLDHELVAAARDAGAIVTGEIEIAYHFANSKIVAVTGTNGKSTVVNMLGAIFERANRQSVMAGNIGTPMAEVVAGEIVPEIIVLEISSFQLDTINDFVADVAVLVNVTPDHLDRYNDSIDDYARSKARLLKNATASTVLVYNADDEICSRIAEDHDGPRIAFSSSKRLDSGVFMQDNAIVVRHDSATVPVIPLPEFSPVGIHNRENAMAAIAATMPFAIDPDVVRGALREYRPLPHRMELVRVVDGVAYINDSKATNVDAALKSIRSVDGTMVLIIGGLDKNGDFKPIAEHLDNVSEVIVIGAAADKLRAALNGHNNLYNASSLEDAVREASRTASAGDTVLLAPACASFDMFTSYEARGEAFRAAVHGL